MNTYIFLLPLYNDWESFVILSKDINIQMKNMNKTAEILIINDFSTQKPPSFKPLSNIKHKLVSANAIQTYTKLKQPLHIRSITYPILLI